MNGRVEELLPIRNSFEFLTALRPRPTFIVDLVHFRKKLRVAVERIVSHTLVLYDGVVDVEFVVVGAPTVVPTANLLDTPKIGVDVVPFSRQALGGFDYRHVIIPIGTDSMGSGGTGPQPTLSIRLHVGIQHRLDRQLGDRRNLRPILAAPGGRHGGLPGCR